MKYTNIQTFQPFDAIPGNLHFIAFAPIDNLQQSFDINANGDSISTTHVVRSYQIIVGVPVT